MDKNNKTVNVGLVGYKFMGKVHSHAYHDVDMFFQPKLKPVMKVICGRTENLVKEAARVFNWEEYETSWEKLVKRKDIDLVDIVTPTAFHHDIVIAAAKEGKHVFCEKPMALNLKEAREMLQAVEKAGVKHMIAFNYRKVPALGLAKRLIEEGKLGKIYHFRAVYLQDWIIDPEFPLTWQLQKEMAGAGAHWDLNSHLTDLARFLIGNIEEVVGMSETFIKERPKVKIQDKLTTGLTTVKSEGDLEKVTVDDTTLFLARFKNGTLGSFEATRFAQGRKNGQRIEINGSKGSLVFEFENMNVLWYYSAEDPKYIQGFRKILATETEHPYISAWWPAGHIIGYEHAFIHLVYELLEGIADDKMPSPNFIDGVKCTEVLEAVVKSVAERRWVKISELSS